MEIILLKDVEKVGAEGAVVRVKSGFARNYLIPHGLAARATPQQLATVQEAARRQQQKAERQRAEADTLKRKIEGRSLTMQLSLGAEDKAFGAITTHDVCEALAREGITVEKHAVHLEQPIKSLGIYEIPVRVHPDVTATLKLWVVKA